MSLHARSLTAKASSYTFQRLYSSSPSSLPHSALVARTASTPLAVRLRRRKKFGPVAPGASDATSQGLTPTDHARLQRLRAKGDVRDDARWIENLNARRTRIRGFVNVKQLDGATLKKVVGRAVYLPNIIFRLVRNHTPPGQPYNPYEATFRIPKSITKTDIRSYLHAVYGVETTYIRTDNYISPIYPRRGFIRMPHKTYKRAVVGLVDPFYYPLRLEDMEQKEQEKRRAWIEQNFAIQHTRNLQKLELLRVTRGNGSASWKLNAPFATKRSHILRLVAERRQNREGVVAGYTAEIQELRRKGEYIDIKKLKKIPSPPEQSSDVPATAE